MCLSQFLFVFTERYQALVAWHSFLGSRLILSTASLTSPAKEANHCEKKLNKIISEKKTFIVGALCLLFVSSWNSRHSACDHSCKSIVKPRLIAYESFQEHATTVFCKISVRRSRCCLEFSSAWGRLKSSRWPFHSCTIFEAYLINSLRFSKV